MQTKLDFETEEENILVTLTAEDGKRVIIAVPKQDHPYVDLWRNEGDRWDKPVGLNLVYDPEGHHYL